MELHLIDYPDQWDAVQIVERAASQVWDETLAVRCPLLDSRRDVIPAIDSDAVWNQEGYKLLRRIETRIMDGWRGNQAAN